MGDDRVHPPEKSIAFYVGKDRTADGSVLLGGFGHEPSSHWLEITPRREFDSGTTVEVGITEEARLPGERIRVPQVATTAKYITSNYSEFAGFPPPLTNGGLNEHHLAGRDVWSPSRSELIEMTPAPQTGVNYSDLARFCMERATTAREAVDLIGELIDTHGYATYGGNSHLFADPTEGWIVIEFAGGEGLWAAERLGSADIRVSYPGYIGDFPLDFADRDDFRGSANLVSFAVQQGWFDPTDRETINLHAVYGQPFPTSPEDDPDSISRHPPTLEAELAEMTPVSVRDMLALVRDPRWADDSAGYGQVAHLRPNQIRALGTLWVAVTTASAAPCIPIPIGATDVPPAYKQHRYLTKGSATTYLHPEYASIEATQSAVRLFKRLFYHLSEHPEELLGPVTAAIEAFETAMLERQPAHETAVRELLEADNSAATRRRLTERLHTRLNNGLRLAEQLLAAIESPSAPTYAIRLPDRDRPEGATWRPESQSMTHPPDLDRRHDRPHCFVPQFDSYPRAHGSYADLLESTPLLDDIDIDPTDNVPTDFDG
ncbi:MAG: C69 family dipeptidase [Halobacteriales archaeon]